MSGARRHRNTKNEIRLALGKRKDCVIFNNESGVARHPQFVRYGVGKGGADLIGLTNGRFVALEVKTGAARLSAEQKLFRDLIERHGGFYAVVRNTTDASEAIDRAQKNYPHAIDADSDRGAED